MLLIKYTLLYAMVLMLVALGGCFSEHSGIINIALEGIMTIGGLVGIAMLVVMPAGTSNSVILLVSIGAAGLSGILYSALLDTSRMTELEGYRQKVQHRHPGRQAVLQQRPLHL